MVLMEALAAGMPAVATQIAASELIEDRRYRLSCAAIRTGSHRQRRAALA